ncbi:hypothetical protein MYK68_04900 [Gordonia sp. PP30]|uniref:hypothetical protein n=1 Tax=Gordonia sp. PP30 TaxID=2935861 RepID=UPI001FFF8E34|nr:hypothetical protein [Gordonia sp. PP30]UQE75941.1 hypothetical protein MYK68_04900 [Gordonia sp. PP30]
MTGPQKEVAGPEANGTGDQMTSEDHGKHTALTLLSAIIAAPTAQVAEVLTVCTPDDVRLIDAPVAAALDVAKDLADAGIQPVVEVLHAECMRRGLYAGQGRLIALRIVDAFAPSSGRPPVPELLPELAAACLAAVFRARLDSACHGIGAVTWTAPESDLWTWLLREGQVARDTLGRLARLRGERADD